MQNISLCKPSNYKPYSFNYYCVIMLLCSQFKESSYTVASVFEYKLFSHIHSNVFTFTVLFFCFVFHYNDH